MLAESGIQAVDRLASFRRKMNVTLAHNYDQLSSEIELALNTANISTLEPQLCRVQVQLQQSKEALVASHKLFYDFLSKLIRLVRLVLTLLFL
jgi:hypothetical protein